MTQERVVISALVALALLASGCGGGSSSPEKEEAKEAKAQRDQRAQALFRAAELEPPHRKIDLYGKFVSLFPEHELASEAHMKLVYYSLDVHPDRIADALQATRTFAERFKSDLRASECFRILDNHCGIRDERGTRTTIQKEWLAYLKPALAAVKVEEAESRWNFSFDIADALMRQRLPEEAVQRLDQTLKEDIQAKQWVVKLLILKGQILARDLGQKKEAAEAYEKALVMVRAGVKGESVERLESWIGDLRK